MSATTADGSAGLVKRKTEAVQRAKEQNEERANNSDHNDPDVVAENGKRFSFIIVFCKIHIKPDIAKVLGIRKI